MNKKINRDNKKENAPSKKAIDAFNRFIKVCESANVILKTGAFYEKETLRYFKRLINSLAKLQKYSDFLSKKQINEIKLDANRLLDKEMKRIKYIHNEARKELRKFR